jgi:HEAT repeat protein
VAPLQEPAPTSPRREEPPSETTAVVDRARTVGPEQLSALIDQLESPDLDRRGAARAALLHHQDAALPLLMARFPGRVSVDPFAAGARIPAFAACGELLQTLAAMGAAAQVPIAERLDDSLPIVRFFALHYFASFTVPEAIPRILRRLHDEEQEIAAAAVNVLGRYRDLPAFRQVLAHLHARFASRTPNARRHAARLLSLFRDPSAVPLFIDVFEKKEKTFYDAAEEALAAITKQRFGPSARKWSAWWEAHSRSPRTEWLIEGLDAGDADLRRSAAQELRSLSGFDSGFDENAPRRARDEAKRKWVSWWLLQNGSSPRAR